MIKKCTVQMLTPSKLSFSGKLDWSLLYLLRVFYIYIYIYIYMEKN